MIEKITDRVSAVLTEDGFTASNCMLVKDETVLMIDSGCGSIILKTDPGRVNILLNSHHHIDHIGGNDFFANARIMAHPVEKADMQHPEKLSATDTWGELMYYDNFLHAREIDGQPNRLHGEWRVDDELKEDQVLDCGRTKIKVLHTPGHTAGHCSFHFLEENIIFAADICLTKVGPWYGDSKSDIDQFLASINRIIDMKPEKLVTGHLNRVLSDTAEITERLSAYRDKILKRDDRLLKIVKEKPCTIDELAIMHIIYPDHPNDFVLYWEKSIIRNHLLRLIRKGEVQRIEDNKYSSSI